MKQIILFLLITSCTNTKKINDEVKPDYNLPFSKAQIQNSLNETLSGLEPLIAYPKFDYVFELGWKALFIQMFNKNGENVVFEICYADYPKPILRNLEFLRKPIINKEVTLESYTKKLKEFPTIEDNFDFILFFHWTESDKSLEKLLKIHKEIYTDVENLKNQGIRIKVINVYVGNTDEFNVTSQDFKNMKRDYYDKHIKDKYD